MTQTHNLPALVQQLLTPDGLVHGCGCGTPHPRRPSACDTDPARWRRIRTAILRRDGKRCRVPVSPDDPAQLCGAPATDCGHILARSLGGCDHPANLRAECKPHNTRDGASLGNALRTVTAALTHAQHITAGQRPAFSEGGRQQDVGSPGTELEFAL